jgi:hypothetical protein
LNDRLLGDTIEILAHVEATRDGSLGASAGMATLRALKDLVPSDLRPSDLPV